jgi:hypothetical protein
LQVLVAQDFHHPLLEVQLSTLAVVVAVLLELELVGLVAAAAVVTVVLTILELKFKEQKVQMV